MLYAHEMGLSMCYYGTDDDKKDPYKYGFPKGKGSEVFKCSQDDLKHCLQDNLKVDQALRDIEKKHLKVYTDCTE